MVELKAPNCWIKYLDSFDASINAEYKRKRYVINFHRGGFTHGTPL